MIRNLLKILESWKIKVSRRPLLLRGARQVGKTWIVREHGKSYDTFVELNLEERPEYAKPFKELYGQPGLLIQSIENITGQQVNPGATLLFIDEIQDCPEALLSLRYFKEKMPELHVIAAGSLLEFSLKEHSFPVGRIEFAFLFPLSFEEFLQAQGRGDLISRISEMSHRHPADAATHDLLIDLYSIYSVLGGLPEVIQTYIDGGSFQECQDIQQLIVGTYREDFHKYASKANVGHLRKLFERAPALLGQAFKYSHVDRETKSRELSKALDLLEEAGLVYRVTHSSANGSPLLAQEKQRKFKLHFVDIGLCQRLLGVEIGSLITPSSRVNHVLKGALTEQFVAQELISLTPSNEKPRLHYWCREAKSSKAEVDFLWEYNREIFPIEVKSGTGGSMKSLHIFMKEKKQHLSHGFKASQGNWSLHDGIESIPFYGLANRLGR